MQQRIQAQHLQTGDIVGTGETVLEIVLRSISWPSYKVRITLQKGNRIRSVLWGKYTFIGINRPD